MYICTKDSLAAACDTKSLDSYDFKIKTNLKRSENTDLLQ
jgi:hypothetical protein